MLVKEMEEGRNRDQERIDRNRCRKGKKQEGRESSKERKAKLSKGKTDAYLSQQTKTREDTQGVI